MTSRPRLMLVKSKNCGRDSPELKPLSESSAMPPADSWLLPRVAQKLAKLHALRPIAVDVIEKLVDDVLDDIEGRRP